MDVHQARGADRVTHQARAIGHMELSTTGFSAVEASPSRRCAQCAAFLSIRNADRLCFPCQRSEAEALWRAASRGRGRTVDDSFGG